MGTDVLQSAELLSPNMPELIGVKEVDLLKKIVVLFFALIVSAAICFAYSVRFDDKQYLLTIMLLRFVIIAFTN